MEIQIRNTQWPFKNSHFLPLKFRTTNVVQQGNVVPGPLPLGVSVIDAAIALFGLAFPHVAPKHRLQMLIHFAECVKQSSKNAARQRTIQINVFTALICALKGI